MLFETNSQKFLTEIQPSATWKKYLFAYMAFGAEKLVTLGQNWPPFWPLAPPNSIPDLHTTPQKSLFIAFLVWAPDYTNGNARRRRRGTVLLTLKKFWSKKFFLSESIQNVSKRILNQKSRNRKFFPCKFFLLGLCRFSAKNLK